MQDLEEFYLESDTWSSIFVPSYIARVGTDPNPWAPKFNILEVMQELRDKAYPNTTHILDKQSPVYHIVSH